MSLIREEELLLAKLLYIRTNNQPIGVIQQTTFLPQISQDIQNQSKYISLNESTSLIDQIMFERFNIPQTNILEYASDCYHNISQCSENKPLLEKLKESLMNYSSLSLALPEMFPQSLPAFQDNLQGNRFLHHMLNDNPTLPFLQDLYNHLKTQGDPTIIFTDFFNIYIKKVQEEQSQKTKLIELLGKVTSINAEVSSLFINYQSYYNQA